MNEIFEQKIRAKNGFLAYSGRLMMFFQINIAQRSDLFNIYIYD